MHQALIVSLVTPEQKCLVMCCFSGTCSSGRPGTSPIPCSLFIRIPVIPGYGCIKKMSGDLFRNRIAAADLRPVVHIHRDYGNADDLVVLVEAHDLHTFGTTPDDPDLADRCPDDNAGRGHDKDLVGPGDGPRLDDNGIAFEHHGADSLRCPAVPPEVVELGPLPEADIGNREERVLVINESDRTDRVLFDPEPHTNDPGRVPSHHPDGLLMEPQAVPETGR